jgi:hypothetical protein
VSSQDPKRPSHATSERVKALDANRETAIRAARFRFARDRINKIVNGWPKLTDEQLAQLALLLRSGGES